MAEIVTLNKVRKAKAKQQQNLQAETNRVLHGLPKSAKQQALADRKKAERDLDGKKIP